MAEIVDRDVAFKMLRGFTPLQRVLLATAGTLQGALSAYFGSPVTIELVHQAETDGHILREVDLVCAAKKIAVGHAVTEAQVIDPDIRRLLLEGEMGLGQISTLLGTPVSFALVQTGRQPRAFWRVYRLWGEGFSYRIREVFPESLYLSEP
jgi:chorismate-pyruvate lyase